MDVKELIEHEYHSLVADDIQALSSSKFTTTMPAASKFMLEEIATLFNKSLTRYSGDLLHDITQELFHHLWLEDKKRLAAIVEAKTRQYLQKTAEEEGGTYISKGDVTPFPYYAELAEKEEATK